MRENMDEKGIVFVIHTSGGENTELVDLLGQLRVPAGYHAGVVTITGGTNRAAAYNAAMRQNDAKYKIYLDENVRIFEETFLEKILAVFQQNTQIGLLGLSGAIVLSTNGVCQTSQKRAGRIIIGHHPQQFVWEQTESDFQEVAAVDGYLMATQYDIPWREDLFSGLSFFDTAQCIEFQRRGYKVVVPQQKDFWAYSMADGYPSEESSRNIFLDEYSKDVYPLVSIVIPTYNRPAYFRIALESVIHQTYRNLDIFITDNSHNDLTENLMKEYLAKDPRITYEHHAEYDALGNWGRARSYDNPKAAYVNWLMDDDVFALDKIEKMMEYYLNETGITLVTSYRRLIDGSGQPLPDMPWSKPLVKKTTRMAGQTIGTEMLTSQNNIIGEPSTVLVKKKYLTHNYFGWNQIDPQYRILDYPTWLNMMSQGDLIYVAEPLSCFRWHSGQEQKQISTNISLLVCWALEIEYAWREKIFLDNAYLYKKAIRVWLPRAVNLITTLMGLNYRTEGRILVEQYVKKFVSFLLTDRVIRHCPCCGEDMETFLPIDDYYASNEKKYGTIPWHSEMINHEEYSCEHCGASDRERAYALWMNRELPHDESFSLLDIAPSAALSAFIRKNFPLADYKTADLLMPGVDYQMDIMDMKPLDDGSVDFFICSHVLEHVQDDIQAMRELKRILAPEGKGILVVPMDLNQKEIDEDPSCTDIGERWRRFGQDDHVRKYSREGYVCRLESVGFIVKQYQKDYFGMDAIKKNGLCDTVNVYVVSKS